ncbi:hypothetical protein PSAB6_390096 [Paraburkholderia sabiae]|nr:hypothetical protein PSAB6_390096 [Paraburkholderia sabiae]
MESGRRAIFLRLLFRMGSGRLIECFIRLRILPLPYVKMRFKYRFRPASIEMLRESNDEHHRRTRRSVSQRHSQAPTCAA